jgi:hypothetical protein
VRRYRGAFLATLVAMSVMLMAFGIAAAINPRVKDRSFPFWLLMCTALCAG